MQNDDAAVAARVTAGEPVAPVEFWDLPQRTGHLMAVAGNHPDLSSLSSGQRIAFAVRYALLDALIRAGILDRFMEHAKLRQKVFAAAASLPCDINDFGEAMMLKRLRESSPDVVEKMKEEMRQAGYDPNHPKLGEKFVSWMDQNV